MWTAATSTHFAHPGNRFYPALLRGGVIDRVIDRGTGMTDDDRRYLVGRGIGITNLVARATPRASELTAVELREGGDRLRRFVAEHRPRVVAVAGVTAYRDAFGRRDAVLGRQPDSFDGAELWVVPNPSGLNAHETIDTPGGRLSGPGARRRDRQRRVTARCIWAGFVSGLESSRIPRQIPPRSRVAAVRPQAAHCPSASVSMNGHVC